MPSSGREEGKRIENLRDYYLVLFGAVVNRFERGKKGLQDDIWIQQLFGFWISIFLFRIENFIRRHLY